MLVETEDFIELDFSSISEILASSNLQIDSEVEVYNAANKWLSFKTEERSKFAKQLLIKVRLNLLSDQTLKYLLNESSCFSTYDECVKVLNNEDSLYHDESVFINKSRHCDQDIFSILVCGGHSYDDGALKRTKQLCTKDLNKVFNLSPMIKDRYDAKAVSLKGEIFVFGGYDAEDNRVNTVEKYSPATNTWNKVSKIPDKRQSFCACAFMGEVYLFGGQNKKSSTLDSCLRLHVFSCKKNLKWKQIAAMSQLRRDASCSIFEGNIVVSGGTYNDDDKLNTVELYNVFANTWKPMPSMIEARSYHSLVCVLSKLFAIDCSGCEVFDETCNRFVMLKTPEFNSEIAKAMLVGDKILAFLKCSKIVYCYDFVKDEWSEESCEATENICCYSITKMPLH